MARRALSTLVFALGFASREQRALASPLPETLAFELSACRAPDLDATSLADAMRSELEADGIRRVIDAPDPDSDGSLTVRVECDAALTARVSLKANRTGREQKEQIALGDAAPSARARALALAVAELVRADWPALSDTQNVASTADAASAIQTAAPPAGKDKPPAPPPSTAPPPTVLALTPRSERPEADRALAPRAAAAFRLSAGARLRWFVDYRSVLLGGEVGTDFRALRLRAEVLVGSASDALGSASFGSAALGVGYRILDWRPGALNLAAYPMASAGLTWLRGDSAQSSTRVEPATGFYGDVRAVLEASVPRWALAPTLSMDVGRASGFVARSGDRTLGATGGFFFGASAGGRY